MKTIPIIGGEITPERLGRTLMHEHVFVRTPELQEAWPGFMGWDEAAVMASAKLKLAAIKDSGIDTIVDMTAPGLGRQVRRVAQAVEGTGLQIIVATGYYTLSELPLPMLRNGPGRLFNDDPYDSFLVDLFVGDVEDGIEGTSIRAGILKCCTDEPGVTPDVERVIRAVARAHLRTGVPISTHSHAKTRRGLEQQRIFKEEGVDLSRVLIGHSNETGDIDYLEQLLTNGSYVGFDRCGVKIVHPLEDQVETLVELCRRGHASRLVLSQDRHCATDQFPEDEVSALLPEWRYDFIQDELLPQLRARGIDEGVVDQLMIGAPRAFFAGSDESPEQPGAETPLFSARSQDLGVTELATPLTERR
jgi:phosphotriesterase-related protein